MTEWTIRLATLLYVAAAATMIAGGARRARTPWTAACLLYVAHVASAFHFVHEWSHASAYRETARQTAELIGFDWGGGLYWNYLFTLVWTADAAWWWIDGTSYERRPRWVTAAVHGFVGFMFVNGVVVFATGPVRWAGAVATAALAALAIHRYFSK
jgi:hypothetical protein